MSFEIAGTIVAIGETKTVSENFTVREFKIKTADAYPQVVQFQLTKEKCGILEQYGHSVGSEVVVKFNIRGRDWEKNGKSGNMTTLEAWRIDKDSAKVEQPTQPAPAPKAKQAPQPPAPRNVAPIQGSDEDNLPF